jgi:hypothetical protein
MVALAKIWTVLAATPHSTPIPYSTRPTMPHLTWREEIYWVTQIAPLFTGVVTLAAVLVGFWQFYAQQRQMNQRPFFQRQLELCFQASQTVSRVATEVDPIKWEQARIAFWRLYWGPLSIVENQAVEAVMVELGRIVPIHPVSSELPMESLQRLSLELAHQVRALVAGSWDVTLRGLQPRPQAPQPETSEGPGSKMLQ